MTSKPIKDKSKDKKNRKEKGKGKEKVVSTEFVEDSGDDETSGNAYQPPEGSVLLKNYIDTEEFDYDTLKDNDDLELWIIRVPQGVKPKHFENAKISLPSSLSTGIVGTLSRKNTEYDIWSVRDEGSDQTTIAGGDEVLGLGCLVPRKRKGAKLFTAAKPITRHLVLTAHPALPTPPPDLDTPITGPFKGPERYKHPKQLLKHRFVPCGTIIDPSDTPVVEMEVDKSETQVVAAQQSVSGAAKEDKLEKKRKVDSGSPKKKKTKAAA